MTGNAVSNKKSLIVQVGTRVCALPLEDVIETMRPLPIEPLAGTPSFVPGVSLIRGTPTPVVELGILLGAPEYPAGRFVTVRLGERQAALSVSAVLGIDVVDAAMAQQLPPLLRAAPGGILETIGSLDEQLLMILQKGWDLPPSVWEPLAAQRKSL
jgi:purine-binding chemotaxis protein CheW